MKIGLGLTTYKDIRSPTFAEDVFEALSEASPKLAPSVASIAGERFPIGNVEDFSKHWCCERVFVVRPKYGVAPPPLRADVGIAWRTKGTLAGHGELHLFPSNDPNAANGLTLHHTYASKVDWVRLFERLVALLEPSHALLHLFTPRELQRAGTGRFAFTQAFSGENHFTAWQASSGDWRRPDPWQREERRRYRFLPDLAWANAFGREFHGRYETERLRQGAARLEQLENVDLVYATERIDDMRLRPEQFEDARLRMRSAFAEDVFRT